MEFSDFGLGLNLRVKTTDKKNLVSKAWGLQPFQHSYWFTFDYSICTRTARFLPGLSAILFYLSMPSAYSLILSLNGGQLLYLSFERRTKTVERRTLERKLTDGHGKRRKNQLTVQNFSLFGLQYCSLVPLFY